MTAIKETKQYSGTILVHARAILEAAEIATSISKSKPLQIGELSKFLSLVSLHALSTHIYYDSSIPKEDAEKTDAAINLLGLSSFITPSRQPEPEQFKNDTALAVEMAGPLFQKTIKNTSFNSKVTQVNQNKANAFFGPLINMAKENSEDTRREIAFQAYNHNVMGGKILVGLSEPSNEGILRLLGDSANEINERKPERFQDLLPRLVNTFRYFLLSNWSTNSRALYATITETEQTRRTFRNMVWPTIEAELCRLAKAAGRPEWPRRIPTKDPTEQVIPLLGLAALDRARPGNHPADLFQIVQEEVAKDINLKPLVTLLINSQMNYDGGNKPDKIAQELWSKIKEFRRQKIHSKELSFQQRAIHDITPWLLSYAAGGYGAQKLVQFLSDVEPSTWESLAAGAVGGTIVRLGWLLADEWRKKGKEPNYLASISSVMMTFEQVSLEELRQKVTQVWGSELAGVPNYLM